MLCLSDVGDLGRALKELSLARKQAGEWPAALELWRQMCILNIGDPFPVTETAKVLEHHLDDPMSARVVVQQALDGGRWIPRDRAALQHRRMRLARKLGVKT